MPLPFNSISHGTISFGFFNIKTDTILLDKYAFFSTDFCTLIEKVLTNATACSNLEIFRFNNMDNLGDLHGSISGRVYEGFIGSVYNLFPFPKNLYLFKQALRGYKTQEIILPLLKQYSQKNIVSVELRPEVFSVGEYKFSLDVFNQLLNYVIKGGYPRWEKRSIPDYVKTMITVINSSRRVSRNL